MTSHSTLECKWRRQSWTPCHVTETSSASDPVASKPSKTLSALRSLKGLWKKTSHHKQPDEQNTLDEDRTMQFFKEERTDDAVYNVYLKKVQYHIETNSSSVDYGESVTEQDRFPCSEQEVLGADVIAGQCSVVEDDGDNKAHLQWRLEEVRVIKYGTLRKLVAALSSDTGQLEVTNVNTFLTTCRTFASTKEVVDELIARYRDVELNISMKRDVKEGHMKTIRMVISAWLDTYPDDFNDSPHYAAINTLLQFSEVLPTSELHRRISGRLASFRNEVSPVTSCGPSSSNDKLNGTPRNINNYCHPADRRQDFNANFFGTNCTDILSVPSRHIAEQLTYIDADLFKRVNPQQCLGSVWSRRQCTVNPPLQDGATSRQQTVDSVATVSATVNQFNAVTYRVIATIVRRHEPHQPPLERAQIIEKWIDIAQECRRLKNFSSLKSILSGLQSTAVYRLQRVWAAVNRQKVTLYEELAAIFSEENNQQTWREILNKEGTAKFASDTLTTRTMRNRKKSSWSWGTVRARRSHSLDSTSLLTVQGTVPYLGTFLTDLTMVDTAFRDTTDDGLINFDKRRREFEILTQIKLFQSAASLYHILPDVQFSAWFQNIPTYDDKESYQLSCEIEPEITWQSVSPFKPRLHKFSSFCQLSAHRLSISVTSAGSTDDVTDLADTSTSSFPNSRSSTLRLPSRLQESPGTGTTTPEMNRHMRLRHSISAGSLLSPSQSARFAGSTSDTLSSSMTSSIYSDDRLIVKVFLATEEDSMEAVHYKSILLANSDHTRTVLRTVLAKYNLTASTDEYILVQSLPDGSELSLPEKGNIFYAVNTSVPEIKFIVRKKSKSDSGKLSLQAKKSR